jgi:alkyl hydroperoxide reductase subunit D
VLRESQLTPTQGWAVALSAAYFQRLPTLAAALLADGKEVLRDADIADAQAAAALMGMTTVYYRFRHLVGRPAYASLRANLRMNRMHSPATSKGQFELCAMGCAALAGCEACIKAHDASLIKEGFTEEQVNDVIRIVSSVAGFGIASEIAGR